MSIHSLRQDRAQKKMCMFERMCVSHDIVATQETHGHPGDIDHLSMQLPSHLFG